MRNKGLILIVIFLTILSWNSQSFSLEEKTHQAINEHVAKKVINGFSLNDYLINNLGFKKGVDEFLNGVDAERKVAYKEVFWWIGEGGILEDRPGAWYDYFLGRKTRSVNHFHDPLTNKGFGGFIFGTLFSGESSILWSQKPVSSQTPGGYYSWFDTRDYFHKALTSSTKTDRDKYFTETFRGIGQLTHLVQDISVPSHTRNEFHAGYHYEGFVLNYQKEVIDKYKGKFDALLANPVSFDQSLLNLTSPLAPLPFANIFDSEKYADTNPDPAVTLSPDNS